MKTQPKVAVSDGRSVRASRKRVATRERILEAAERVFSRRGYHDASISDVIDEAGISRGTFYLHFTSKDEIFLQLVDRFVAFITSAVRVVDPRQPEPAQRILDNVRRVVGVACDHPELTRLVLRENRGRSPEIDKRLDRLYDFLQAMVEGALRNGEKSGLTRAVAVSVVATALIGAFKEVFVTRMPAVPTAPPEREALSRALFEFGIRGLLLAPPQR